MQVKNALKRNFFCVSPLALSYDSLPLVEVQSISPALRPTVHRRAHARLARLFQAVTSIWGHLA
jgi:hypothetical protein